MSRRWCQSSAVLSCGRCGTGIPQGQPFMEVTGEAGWKLCRCEQCAGETAPEMPVFVPKPRVEIPAAMVRRPSTVTQLARDWKLKQARDDE